MILHINPDNPQARLIRMAAQKLRDGEVIAFPTDTVYGLGTSLLEKKAIERLYHIKRVDHGHPMSLLCSDLKHLSHFAQVSTPAYKVMRHLIPGAYTFILPATREVPKLMLRKQHTVGLRVPDNNVIRDLVAELGHPLINTSAQITDQELYLTAEDIEERLGKQLGCVIDGGVLTDVRSTILDLTKDEPVVVRWGKGVFEFA